ncbi:LacI family transcriptional regulator [Kribbella amoyensis]|uniref:LacI family transcriptional regulator n=1 Tax=Kribbella amoyensis TaxID=996641 RepID=A0A561B8B3_9ACTN|nr:LacI family DNA-binding transcriptional regulator [Kribbella amoyensis]TWD75201.1 LacI family transcriptional regulator [Kribbella amoyensis]
MTPAATGRGGRVTISDVAALAGVDKAIVSRVVNQKAVSIRPETRERVLQAIQDLGYRRNMAARSLRTASTGAVGLFIPDFANPVYAEIITGAETAALARGYVLMVGSSAVAGHRTRDYLETLGEGRVDGLLLAGGPISQAEQETLDAQGLPWLLVNRRGRATTRHVVLDDDRAAQVAVNHLVELGHQRIAHVAGPAGADTARRRREGYRKALRAAGLEPETALVAAADYTPAGGYEATSALFASGRRPTALFVANVASAIGVLTAVCERGLSVPDDVSVVAVHDLPLAEHLVPALTTVRMPLRSLGARATELLLENDPQQPVAEVVRDPIELVIRKSTAPARRRR